MNYIVLEGVSLYLFLLLVILLLLISLGCLICAILADKRCSTINNLIKERNYWYRQDFNNKLKRGEIDIDE